MSQQELTAAEKVRIARTNVTHEPKLAGCVDCEEKAPIRAVILSPNLGTPLVLQPGQTKCSLFIAAEGAARQYFGILEPLPSAAKNCLGEPICEAKYGPVFVDRHLRLQPLASGKPTTKEAPDTMLFRDNKAASMAMTSVKVWHVGKFAGGLIANNVGEPVAILRGATVQQYSKGVPLTDIYEIELDLSKVPGLPDLSKMCTFAWMVPVPQAYANRPEVKGVDTWEYQDQVILDFLDAQRKDPNKAHYPSLYEFDLSQPLSPTGLPRQQIDARHRLMAWHPVIRSAAATLKIGHLSDVHVNVRQNALAKSPAYLLELPGGSPAPDTPNFPPAYNLCNSFNALFELVKAFATGDQATQKSDVLVITGDLLDFNRNLDPGAIPPNSIAGQWRAFNVLNNIRNPALYKRGLDDMLVYSLLRHAYRTWSLPVFLTTGNHEAYQVPYGISPRKNSWVYAMGALEAGGMLKGPHGKRQIDPGMLGKAADAATEYNDFDLASDWAEGKANDGIAADHNLTIYEACLAYGPTYAQAITADNFDRTHYDWFFTLFTPLSDWRCVYGKQCLLGLDWGEGEEYKNLSGALPMRADKQGYGILPRASGAISDHQHYLLDWTRYLARERYQAKLLLFSHFTFVSYDTKVAFSDPDRQFVPAPGKGKGTLPGQNGGGWNFNNMGTCERKLDWFFQNCVNQTRKAGVDVHFSGHSHRAGVYTTASRGNAVTIESAFDPGLQSGHAANSAEAGKTKFIVSSCGGPIGVQNLNHGLGGWTLTPPSGTRYDGTAKHPIQQVAFSQGSAKPRLAVALDYMHISKAERVLHWEPSKGNAYFMVVGPKTHKLACIESVRLWGFHQPPKQPNAANWISFDTDLEFRQVARGSAYETPAAAPQSGIYMMKVPAAREDDIARLQKQASPRWFREVKLKAPAGFPADHFQLDPWCFPVDFTVRSTGVGPVPTLQRRPGEQGEVPDWTWLNQTFGKNRYPDPLTVIRGST
ncbi:hypothetical protein D9M70_252930 [compost metagenome]